jgi:hypothetical protein
MALAAAYKFNKYNLHTLYDQNVEGSFSENESVQTKSLDEAKQVLDRREAN